MKSYLKVYRNLHQKRWSVKSSKTGRVVDHVDNFEAENVRFKVSKAGNARVRKEKRKNVHAYLCTEQLSSVFQELKVSESEISYNPYLSDQFYIQTGTVNIFIDQKWVFDRVISRDQKLYCSDLHIYRTLKKEGVDFSPLNLFFGVNQDKVAETIADYLKTVIAHKEIILDSNPYESIEIMSDETANFYIFDHNLGLCESLDSVLGINYELGLQAWLKAEFEQWEHFSGNNAYPIKSLDTELDADKYYKETELYLGEYGEKRFELAEYLLKQVISDKQSELLLNQPTST